VRRSSRANGWARRAAAEPARLPRPAAALAILAAASIAAAASFAHAASDTPDSTGVGGARADSTSAAAARADSVGAAAARADSARATRARADSVGAARARSGSPAPDPRDITDVTSSAGAEGVRIARVDVIPRNIFDPIPPGRLGPVYRLANRLHVRTRGRTIREQLLFGPGDPWSEARGEETERNLRALNYLTPEGIRAERRGDSTTVTVVTRDIWSTSPQFNLQSADGRQYGSVAFTETNLFGFGKAFALSYVEDPSGISRSISFDDPGVLGSRLRFHYSAGNGTSGSTDQISAGVPFYSLDTPHAYGLVWTRASSVLRLYRHSDEVAHLSQRLEEIEASWGWGQHRGDLVRRLGIAYKARDRDLGPTTVTAASVPQEFVAGDEDLGIRRLTVEGRLWRPRYIERINVDQMVLIEDFEVGRSLTLGLGFSPDKLGATSDEGFAHVKAEAGTAGRLGFGWIRAGVSSRLRRQLRETLGTVDSRWVLQSDPRRALVFAGYGVLGSRMDRDFEVVVGGLNGLRAYPVHAVTGRRLWRLNLEQRWVVARNIRDLAVLGAVTFVDAARAYGAGSAGAGWFTSAGAGVRLSFPRWSPAQIVRIDVAWPVDPARDGKRPAVLTFGSSQAF
jgi:hypothetical protein